MGEDTNVKFGRYIQRVHANKKPITNLGENGAWAYTGTAQMFWVPPIISGTGKATNFNFCTHIHSIDRNKSPLEISGKVAGCVVRTLKTFQGTRILGASRGLLCYSSAVLSILILCDLDWSRHLKSQKFFTNVSCLFVQVFVARSSNIGLIFKKNSCSSTFRSKFAIKLTIQYLITPRMFLYTRLSFEILMPNVEIINNKACFVLIIRLQQHRAVSLWLHGFLVAGRSKLILLRITFVMHTAPVCVGQEHLIDIYFDRSIDRLIVY